LPRKQKIEPAHDTSVADSPSHVEPISAPPAHVRTCHYVLFGYWEQINKTKLRYLNSNFSQ